MFPIKLVFFFISYLIFIIRSLLLSPTKTYILKMLDFSFPPPFFFFLVHRQPNFVFPCIYHWFGNFARSFNIQFEYWTCSASPNDAFNHEFRVRTVFNNTKAGARKRKYFSIFTYFHKWNIHVYFSIKMLFRNIQFYNLKLQHMLKSLQFNALNFHLLCLIRILIWE